MRLLTGYAGPSIWGPELTVLSHLGVTTVKVSYSAIGDTMVLGRIKYHAGPNGGVLKEEEFNGETEVTTANAVANVICQFKGVPLGSTVEVQVTP